MVLRGRIGCAWMLNDLAAWIVAVVVRVMAAATSCDMFADVFLCSFVTLFVHSSL